MAGASPIVTPRYSYVVRSSTVYHSSTVYERASFICRRRGVTGPAGSGMLGGGRSGSERARGPRRGDGRGGGRGSAGQRGTRYGRVRRGAAVPPVPAPVPALRPGLAGRRPRGADRRARPAAPGAGGTAAAPRPRAVPGRDRPRRHRGGRRRGPGRDQHAADRAGAQRGGDVPLLVCRVQGGTARPDAGRDRGGDRGTRAVR